MTREELEKQIQSYESSLTEVKQQIKYLDELENDKYMATLPEVNNITDAEIGKMCRSINYFNALSVMSRQFGQNINVPIEFSSRSLAELVYRFSLEG